MTDFKTPKLQGTSERIMEGRDVATVDIPGAFMQADIDEELHILFEAELVDLLVQVEPSFAAYVSYKRGKKVFYAKALYGTIQASLLFWKKLTAFLTKKHGFVRNDYEWCVVNKVINGKQATIGWYVDDIKLSHADPKVNNEIISLIQREFGQQMPLTINRGPVHDYLGMRIDFSQKGKVVFSMFDYINDLLKECPDDLMTGSSVTPAANHLFAANPDGEKVDGTTAAIYITT